MPILVGAAIAPVERSDGVDSSKADRSTVYAQQRSAAGASAAIDTVAAASSAEAAVPVSAAARNAVRRRSLFADADAWRTPEVAPPPSAPITPASSSSVHFQPARASAALSRIGGMPGDVRRDSQSGASSTPSSTRRRTSPSATWTFAAFLAAPFRSTHSSVSTASHADPLLTIQPSDLRRPSFQVTDAITVSRSAKSRKPSPYGSLSSRRVLFCPAGGRRAQCSLRTYLLLCITVLVILKVTGRLPFFPRTPTQSTLAEDTHSARVKPARDPDSRPDEALRVRPTMRATAAPTADLGPVVVDVPPEEERAPLGERPHSDPPRGAVSHLSRLPPTSSGDRLVLDDAELLAMQERRAENLWAAPDEELHVEAEDDKKGRLHESTIIFLHGLGQVKNDAFMPAFLHKRFPNTRWVVPLAEKRPVGVSDTDETAWYNIDQFPYEYDRDQDAEGMFATARRINRLIADERTRLIRNLRRRSGAAALAPPEEDDQLEECGTPEEHEWASRRIVLAGFSQGAVMTLLVGLTHRERLGALVVFSGYLPLRDELAKLTYDLDRQDLPIFWGHGTADAFLTFPDAAASLALLAPSAVLTSLWDDSTIPPSALSHTHPSYRLNMTDVTFRSYDNVAHTFCFQELLDVDEWVHARLPEGSQRGKRLPRIEEPEVFRRT